MDHLVYIAASGAGETMLAQAVNTHNLANASSVGFRADLISAQSALLSGEQMGSRVYSGMHNSGVDFREGVINSTGRDLDVAINGKGWIVVMAPDGSEGFSRRGDLHIDEFGQLIDGAGQQIMGNSGPIALPPYSSIAIGADGTVSIVPLGEDPNTLAAIDRIKLVNPDTMQMNKGAGGVIQMVSGEEVAADANVTLLSGSLESSNVDSVGAMVRMIELSRQFEHHIKIMKVAEQLDQASTQLMSLS
ncbi:MAG: flagellar biosynthesis protein FlgF [Gammaproteobacteria bacterium]|nr:MAG: flagellar biosynthesis protein FlgF [Gammaproteobacteria bacterium]RLA57982.1 MAG: flagellar biosynthesis protein FlgF [Gammaproteobacteria bacterium]HDY82112.1 flagellar basal body rod protein FlgF [Halieaceae bacterium]